MGGRATESQGGLGAGVLIAAAGPLLTMMDLGSVTVTLPEFGRAFDARPDDVLWVILGVALVITGASLALGRLGDVYGRARFFRAGVTVFTVSLVLSSVAGSLPELIATRVLAGLGLALVMSNVGAIATAAAPPAGRARALALVAGGLGAGFASGPILGGGILEIADWRAVFWARIPLALLLLVVSWRWLRDPAPSGARGVDVAGSLLLTGMLFVLVLAVNRGAAWGWGSVTIVGLFALGAVGLGLFVWIERRSPSPVMALDLFRIPRFACGIVAAISMYWGLVALNTFVPFYLVQGRGLSALEAGAIVAIFPFTALVVAQGSGWVGRQVGTTRLMVGGILTAATGLFLFSTLTGGSAVTLLIPWLLVSGVGLGLFDAPNMASLMGTVDPTRLGTASASVNTSRGVGQSIGLAVSGALFTAQAGSYAAARSPAGLEDALVRPAVLLPALPPAVLLSGLELAFAVAGVVAVVGAGAVIVGARWGGSGVGGPGERAGVRGGG